jgi:hypothetical protein
MATTVIAQDSTTVEGRVICRGEIWDANDPLVKRHGWLFGDAPEDRVNRSVPAVEQATAAPGERRLNVGRR